jgi:hypothetical protein
MVIADLATQLQQLVGLPVVSKTIAGNSIWLWFDEGKTKGLCIDPPWRLQSQSTIVGTSADFPWEKDEGESDTAYRSRFEGACSNTNCLESATVSAVAVDPLTTDIRLAFVGGCELSSFTVWREEENWTFVDYKEGKRFLVSLKGVEIVRTDAQPVVPGDAAR